MTEENPLPTTIKNPLFFLIWCMNHVRCDDCNRLGGIPTRDSKNFICPDCARMYGGHS